MIKSNQLQLRLSTIFVGLLLVWSLKSQAQDISVEKSTFGIQTGFLGVWVHNESRLTNRIALRSEFGLDAAISSNSFVGTRVFIMVPAITLEPRWYYNLGRRVSKSKRIDGNTGNFISLKITYHPDIVVGNLPANANLISDVSIIPTYGVRRNVGKHFTYEVGFGIGYVDYFLEENVFGVEDDGVGVNLHLRLGYRF
ncbi:hypothetical protein [uncultured Winogradskyella sp.]|uniref:hypothetical protein n=1 Tax=uncultured Winogradskyella sp. TaxID=395353 RepID=UPI0035121DCD